MWDIATKTDLKVVEKGMAAVEGRSQPRSASRDLALHNLAGETVTAAMNLNT